MSCRVGLVTLRQILFRDRTMQQFNRPRRGDLTGTPGAERGLSPESRGIAHRKILGRFVAEDFQELSSVRGSAQELLGRRGLEQPVSAGGAHRD